jgi:hypothetical protein
MTDNVAPQHISLPAFLPNLLPAIAAYFGGNAILFHFAEKSWRPEPPAVQSTESRHDRMPRENLRRVRKDRSTGFMQFFATG